MLLKKLVEFSKLVEIVNTVNNFFSQNQSEWYLTHLYYYFHFLRDIRGDNLSFDCVLNIISILKVLTFTVTKERLRTVKSYHSLTGGFLTNEPTSPETFTFPHLLQHKEKSVWLMTECAKLQKLCWTIASWVLQLTRGLQLSKSLTSKAPTVAKKVPLPFCQCVSG